MPPSPARPSSPRAALLYPSARAVVTAVFFTFGIGLGLWAGAIPALMRQAGLDVAGLGLALTVHTGTYIVAMAAGGQLARRIAPRRLMLLALAANLPFFALVFSATTPLMLMVALSGLGLSCGLLDLAMNAEGTAVEGDLQRPVLLSMHAACSAAFAVGALGGSLLATHGTPRLCALVVVLVTLPAAWRVWRQAPRPAQPVQALAGATSAAAGQGIVRIGIVLGLTAAAEMAAQMWSARFLERQAAELAAFAGAGAALFAGCQAVGRMMGDTLRRHLADAQVIMGSLVLATAGFLTVATSAGFGQSLLGFAMVGLGVACVVPCCFALAARQGGTQAAAALGMASLVAGAIRLPTPMVLGAVAAAYSDAHAFGGIALGLLVALVMTHRGARAGIAGKLPA